MQAQEEAAAASDYGRALLSANLIGHALAHAQPDFFVYVRLRYGNPWLSGGPSRQRPAEMRARYSRVVSWPSRCVELHITVGLRISLLSDLARILCCIHSVFYQIGKNRVVFLHNGSIRSLDVKAGLAACREEMVSLV